MDSYFIAALAFFYLLVGGVNGACHLAFYNDPNCNPRASRWHALGSTLLWWGYWIVLIIRTEMEKRRDRRSQSRSCSQDRVRKIGHLSCDAEELAGDIWRMSSATRKGRGIKGNLTRAIEDAKNLLHGLEKLNDRN